MESRPVEVLVIEDDFEIRRIMRLALESDGYTVFEAPDGMRGLDRLRSHPAPLVVVLDWILPGMDGLEVLRALAVDAPLARRHAFILATALYDAPELDLTEFSPDIAITVLGKPFDLDRLLAVVGDAAARVTDRMAATRDQSARCDESA